MRQRLVFAGLMCCAGPAVFAEPAVLTGDELKTLMTGATVKVDTPFGMQLPVQYTSNGQISGEAGGMAGFLGSPTDHGRWWVETDRLCHKWSRWFDRDVQCLRIVRDGQRLQWSRDDGQKGTATLVTEIQPGEKAPFALGAAAAAIEVPAAPAVEVTPMPPVVVPQSAPAYAEAPPKGAAKIRVGTAATVVVTRTVSGPAGLAYGCRAALNAYSNAC